MIISLVKVMCQVGCARHSGIVHLYIYIYLVLYNIYIYSIYFFLMASTCDMPGYIYITRLYTNQLGY